LGTGVYVSRQGFSLLKRQGFGWHGRMLEDSKICELRDSAGNKLTERAKNVLQRLNIRTLGELCCLDGERLKHTANCGKGTMFQLRDVAEFCGTGIKD